MCFVSGVLRFLQTTRGTLSPVAAKICSSGSSANGVACFTSGHCLLNQCMTQPLNGWMLCKWYQIDLTCVNDFNQLISHMCEKDWKSGWPAASSLQSFHGTPIVFRISRILIAEQKPCLFWCNDDIFSYRTWVVLQLGSSHLVLQLWQWAWDLTDMLGAPLRTMQCSFATSTIEIKATDSSAFQNPVPAVSMLPLCDILRCQAFVLAISCPRIAKKVGCFWKKFLLARRVIEYPGECYFDFRCPEINANPNPHRRP